MSHRDTVYEAPPGLHRAGLLDGVAGGRARGRRARPLRHPVPPRGRPHARTARRSSRRFLRDVCGCDMAWTAASVVEEQIARIREQVGDGRVICGLSGGVDSSVAALLVHRAVGDQLTCVFVDHGLMRKNEGEQVVAAFRDHFKVPLVAVDAEERFLERLAGVTEPEAKRKIIGAEFIRVFEEEAGAARQPEVPRPGHALLGRDRVRRRHRRGDDQVAPQRRRAARGPRVRARRAAAGAVQGRGARRSASSSGCPSGSSGASPSRARAWHPDRRRRGHQGAPRDPARRRLRPPGRDPLRRPLPRAVAVLLRAARRPAQRSACRATSAPTATSS